MRILNEIFIHDVLRYMSSGYSKSSKNSIPQQLYL